MDKPNEIKLGSIPTKNGVLDKQGYNVYSIYGICACITNDSGGIGHNKGGLFLLINKVNDNDMLRNCYSTD